MSTLKCMFLGPVCARLDSVGDRLICKVFSLHPHVPESSGLLHQASNGPPGGVTGELFGRLSPCFTLSKKPVPLPGDKCVPM